MCIHCAGLHIHPHMMCVRTKNLDKFQSQFLQHCKTRPTILMPQCNLDRDGENCTILLQMPRWSVHRFFLFVLSVAMIGWWNPSPSRLTSPGTLLLSVFRLFCCPCEPFFFIMPWISQFNTVSARLLGSCLLAQMVCWALGIGQWLHDCL